MAIMCEDNGHQGVIWSKRKEEDIKPISNSVNICWLGAGASGMDLG